MIDVSGGKDAASYPVAYLDTEPVDGWSDEYKTTKILLRRIEPCRFMMQNNKEVTLTKPYYMGVFTITQRQHEQVMGTNPTQFDHRGEMRPVEISWNAIRGDAAVFNWPTVKTVDSNTFVGKIQAKTGLNFDLPTEAQWENACRAGTASVFHNGGHDGTVSEVYSGHDFYSFTVGNKDLSLLGRYLTNVSVPVGLFLPNLWGLYDMCGNVGQWVLDRAGTWDNDPVIDFSGSTDGDGRLHRGYEYYISTASSFSRFGDAPSCCACFNGTSSMVYLGFRLSRTVME